MSPLHSPLRGPLVRRPLPTHHRCQPLWRRAAQRLARPLQLAAVGVVAGLAAWSASATTLLVDDFSSPVAPVVGTVSGAPASPGAIWQHFDTGSSILGGERVSYLDVTASSTGGSASLAVGDGLAHVQQDPGVAVEALFFYGAYTSSFGDLGATAPRWGLDLSSFAALAFDFKSASDPLNLVITLYTTAPLDPLNPIYYATQGINVAAPPPGTPLTAWLAFDHRPEFNWQQVDGMAVLVNRANPVTGASYRLEALSLVSSVPEPGAVLLWCLGLAGLAGRRWWSAQRLSASQAAARPTSA